MPRGKSFTNFRRRGLAKQIQIMICFAAPTTEMRTMREERSFLLSVPTQQRLATILELNFIENRFTASFVVSADGLKFPVVPYRQNIVT